MSKDIFDEEFDDVWPSRAPSSTRRYRSDARMETGRIPADVQSLSDEHPMYSSRKHPVPQRRAATQPTSAGAIGGRRVIDTEELPSRRGGDKAITGAVPKQRRHPLVYFGLAIMVMIVGWFLLSVVTNWWRVVQDDWHYGRPRTAQYDQIVGHNDAKTPSHFIAINLNRHVEIIEMPGGDATKAKVYLGPILMGQDQDLAPVTLTFKDVTGDGKLDMVVNVQDSHFVFINDNNQFRPPRAGENVQP